MLPPTEALDVTICRFWSGATFTLSLGSTISVSSIISNCSSYFSAVNTTALLPMLELETSLAFSIVVHNQIGLFESLMASIFRPQNSYCIFIDAKASSKFKTLVKALISCYTHQFPKVNLNMFFDQWIN